ncbi:hypothetical protein AA0111_g1141 [Alternaria arborescens]|uniref:hypothetical protein n=1 Tax=Alternaria arborescens TaxID=156630 RepID=UPI0010756E91|nr:hypothetical protein AA0111_g1141 [Alternaria arborescens]RYO40842.1 hypothetical protein AA0111_g1141 [Alternaria arborescens]
MYTRTIFLMASLALPMFAAPVPTIHEVNKRDVNIEQRDSFSLLDSLRDVVKRYPIIEAIPSDVTFDVEHKRDGADIGISAEDDVAEDDVVEGDEAELYERGITRHKGNGKRGITKPSGNGRRGITKPSGNGRRGITRTKGNGKRGITRTKGNGKRSLVARALEYILG